MTHLRNVFYHPQILDFIGLEHTVAKRHSKDPIELQTMAALGILISLCLKTRKQERSHSLDRTIVLNQQVEVRLFLYSEEERDTCGMQQFSSAPLGTSLPNYNCRWTHAVTLA